MKAHPIELIAGMDDGLDIDQKDQLTLHIAGCDTCRTVERTMRRIDGLVAMPEPALPLPERVTSRERVRVAGWASVAVVLTLAVATAVLVQSFRQAQVTSVAAAGADTCGVLGAAARSADVGATSATASAIVLPSPLSSSWTACGYGESATRAGAWLLFRATPTAAWEIRGVLARLVSADPGKQLLPDKFIPLVTVGGDGSAEAWLTHDVTAAQALAVVADPYFFVVTAPSRDATQRLASAIIAELRRRPWPPVSQASKIDACTVVARAAPSVGLPAEVMFPQRRHWAEIVPGDTLTTTWIWNNVCSFHDQSGNDHHLWIRDEPTSLQQVSSLLPLVSGSLANYISLGEWVQIEQGMWVAHGQCPVCPVERRDFSALAVLDGPYFVAFTQATDEAAIRLARAISAELNRP